MRIAALISLLLSFAAGCGASAPPPAPRGEVNRTDWRKLAKGMTQDKVRQVLGEPLKVESQDAAVCWHYEEGRPLERDAKDPSKWVISRGSLLFTGKPEDAAKLVSWREP
jgi:hypothetical protein